MLSLLYLWTCHSLVTEYLWLISLSMTFTVPAVMGLASTHHTHLQRFLPQRGSSAAGLSLLFPSRLIMACIQFRIMILPKLSSVLSSPLFYFVSFDEEHAGRRDLNWYWPNSSVDIQGQWLERPLAHIHKPQSSMSILSFTNTLFCSQLINSFISSFIWKPVRKREVIQSAMFRNYVEKGGKKGI